MADLQKKQELRLQYLNKLYDLVDGDTGKCVGALIPGKEIGFKHYDEVDSIVEYLRGEGLLDFVAFGGDDGPLIRLEHRGVKEIEEARTNPRSRTTHFPPMINIINVQSMNNSQIQQGSSGSSQTQINVEFSDVEKTLKDLASKIQSSVASKDQKDLGAGYIEILEAQATLPEAKRNKLTIERMWASLSNLCTAISLMEYAAQAAPIVKAFFGIG